MEEALQVESRSWKGRQGSDLGNDPIRGPFFRRFVANGAQRGIIRVSFLRISGRAAAMQLGVVCGGRYWLLKSSYNEEFSRCSPGMLLLLESLRYASSTGLSSYELLGTVEPWTRPWTQHVRQCASVRAYPARGLGLASLAAEAARVSFKRMMRCAT
jgi:CelD/BcsL family acetyltransferase involved in cellulose biosynthesis